MRSLALALVGLVLSAGPASAAVIEFEDHFCGCDGSSGDEDTRGIIVRAAPGEANRMSIRVAPRGVVIVAGERVPLQLSIGDGPGDGAAGEGDDIQADVEDLIGGLEADLIVGDDDGNRLVGSGGRDTLLGRAGADRLEGWNDGDELDAGPGRDTVLAGEEDLPVLVDGEADSTFCGGRAPVVEADSLDVFNACAPSVQLRRLRARRGAPIRIEARCATPSAVPCEGRILIHAVRRHRVLRTLRFGPIEPGGRQRLALRLPSGAAGRSCFIGVAIVRRDDSITSVTHNRSALGCVPR
jgi:hypothetical protein